MNTETYDSTKDTLLHIKRVSELLNKMAVELIFRSMAHDGSKLCMPEKEAYDRETPLLKELTFGSQEYKKSLERLGLALQHHYETNSHHPEHYENGVEGMCLLDVIEMLMDWRAASERNVGGNVMKSIEFCSNKFNINPQLKQILTNTIMKYGLNNG
jgi:hypothetical protein